MALETGTFISDLVPTNPTGSDPLAFADDHLRLVKTTIKNTFPNVSGAVTATHAQINTAVGQAATAVQPAALTAAIESARQNAYPVGSVYINATNATNPSSLLGFGTWVAFGAGRVPVGFDSGDTLFNAAEKTGGSKDAVVVSHAHTASTSISDPGHSHTATIVLASDDGGGLPSGGAGAGQDGVFTQPVNANTTGISASTTVASTGSSGTNANVQPYITVYMWKRTA